MMALHNHVGFLYTFYKDLFNYVYKNKKRCNGEHLKNNNVYKIIDKKLKEHLPYKLETIEVKTGMVALLYQTTWNIE